MNVVTGATGFVGGFLSAELWRRFGRVTLLARSINDKSRHRILIQRLESILGIKIPDENTVQMLLADITAPHLGVSESDMRKLKDVSGVWHCAAISQFEAKDESIFVTNALGTFQALQFASRIRAKTFFYVSTAYICGNRQGTVCEDELEAGQRFKNSYEESKFRAEHLVKEWALEFNIKTVIFRPSIIIGSSLDGKALNFSGYNHLARAFSRQRNNILKQLRLNPEYFVNSGIGVDKDHVILPVRIPCSTNASVNLVTIDHVITTMLKIAAKPASVGKVFHITNPSPPQGRRLFEMSAEIMKIKGVSFVDDRAELLSNPPENRILARYEQRIDREISQYVPYLKIEPHFDDSNVRQVLGDDYTPPPIIDQCLIKTLFDYAESVRWKT